ncbi:hypothetical protein [Mycobacterium sp. DL592]|uniref:hypothetical protein n=1 Tax=Mycobacterium sp. DL592 TaxID=2675524 RepID=UPI00142201DA|nr:hypothetical protein [Mycobacterium sp. DL592]
MRRATSKSWLYAAAVTFGLGAAVLATGHGAAAADVGSASGSSVGAAAHSAGPTARAAAATARTRRTTAEPAAAVAPPSRTPVVAGGTRRAPSASVVTAVHATTTTAARAAPRVSGPTPSDISEALDWVASWHVPAGGVVTVEPPSATDAAHTPYGDIGKWMLQSGNQVADWGGVKHGCKTLYEPINIVIVDSTSTSVAQSIQRLDAAMAAAGFPSVSIHSTGFTGIIDGVVYTQLPAATLQAYSDGNFLLPNNHGRVFGPAPLPGGTGYVWTASFSRERVGLYQLLPKHLYVSFRTAREALRAGLVRAGGTDLGLVNLGNTYSTRAASTGDHDGYAAVVMLA